MLTGISRMQRDWTQSDTHEVSLEQGQRGGPRAGQRGRRQSCPMLTLPTQPRTIPESALPLVDLRSRQQQGWQSWQPSGAQHSCSHMLCPTRHTRAATPERWEQHRSLLAKQSTTLQCCLSTVPSNISSWKGQREETG